MLCVITDGLLTFAGKSYDSPRCKNVMSLRE